MMKHLLAIVFVGLMSVGAQAQAGSMFSDPKASSVGDAVTVIISENASASNQMSTSTEKSNEMQVASNIPGAGNVLSFVQIGRASCRERV